MRPLSHQVIVVKEEVKSVSSTEAHRRVITSPRFNGRPERAEARLAELIVVFQNQSDYPEKWRQAFQIVWDEFQDMHELFETSSPSFSYMTDKTQEVLGFLKQIWHEREDGPIVTMDAGANVHCLYREDQKSLAAEIEKYFSPKLKVFSSGGSV